MVTPDHTNVPRLLTMAEAGDALRVSRWTVNHLIQQRELRSIKIGRRRFVPNGAIDDYIVRQAEATS